LPIPSDPETFNRCKLDFFERKKNKHLYDLHIDLMKLRREDSRFHEQLAGGVDGAVLGPKSFVLRYFAKENDERLLLVNLGESQLLAPMPEPLLAPPLGFEWSVLWSSNSEKYGGPGEVALPPQDPWTLPAESTIALRLVRESAPRRKPRKR
jgi:maltooligosyltrehalose trehalohydrolase